MDDNALAAIRELAERYHARTAHLAKVIGVFSIDGSDVVAEVCIIPHGMTRRIFNKGFARNGTATYAGMFKFYGDVVPVVSVD